MFSKRSLEGCITIDHRNSPGISEEFIRDRNLNSPAVPAGHTYESAFVTCHCCQTDIILNPQRTRERAYCYKHDAYLCEGCGAAQKAGAVCIPFRERFDKWFEQAAKGLPVVVN